MRLPTPNRDQSNSSVEEVYFRDIENSRKDMGEIFYSIHYTSRINPTMENIKEQFYRTVIDTKFHILYRYLDFMRYYDPIIGFGMI